MSEILRIDDLILDGEWSVNAELRNSIAAVGQLAPIIVLPIGSGKFRVEDGRGRVAALKALGVETVKAEVRDPDHENDLLCASAVALAGNVRRGNPLSDARSLRDLRDAGTTDDQVRAVSGISKGSERAKLKLLSLADEFQAMLERGDIPLATAKELARLDHDGQRRAWAEATERKEGKKPSARQVAWEVREVIASRQPTLPPVPVPVPQSDNGYVDPVSLAMAVKQFSVNLPEHQAQILKQAADILERL